MFVTLSLRDLLTDIIMVAAIVLILIQRDEYNYMLAMDFHGLFYAAILLGILPIYHAMLVLHGACQWLLDIME